jgi:hypothetical protein
VRKKILRNPAYLLVTFEGEVLPMHVAEFSSETPKHLQRALDELDRGGFDFSEVRLVADALAARIRIAFGAGGRIRAETLLARLERMPGVRDMAFGPSDMRTA